MNLNKRKNVLFNGKKNILWGAGREGKRTLINCISQGIYVDFIVDSDPDKQGLRLLNKKILSPDQFYALDGDCNIVITTNIKENISQIQKNLYENGFEGEIVMGRDGIQDFFTYDINPSSLYMILALSNQSGKPKRIIIYGADMDAARVGYILDQVDVDIAYFVDEEKIGETLCHRPVRSIYDILEETEDGYLVIIPTQNDKSARQMETMGLSYGIEYIYWANNGYNFDMQKEYVLDPGLGYNFIAEDGQFPGFRVFGKKDAKLKIVTLGGSTTDPCLYTFQSWSELLYKKLIEYGIDACVFCGGCAAYKSSQELIKLMRDVVPLRPDIVLDYTGVNDSIVTNPEYAFVNSYQVQLFQYLSDFVPTVENGFIGKQTNKFVCGVKNPAPSWKQFEMNIRHMKMLCEEHGIEYLAFLQPALPIKEKISAAERELVLNTDCFFPSQLLECGKTFYSKKKDLCKYMTDLTHIFDDSDVYLDNCHVTEKGNGIIADAILKELEIRGILQKWL